MRQNSFIAIGITGVVIVIALALFMNNNVVANLVAFTQIDTPTGSGPEATVGDTLTFIAGSNMAIEGDASLDTVTFTATLSGSGATVALDIGNDDVDESAGLNKIAVTAADTNSVFTESSADKLLIDPANNWPAADTAGALSADPSDCAATQFANAIIASGNLTCAQPNFTDLAGTATDAQIPNTITIDLATDATNLAADPTDCPADTKADAIDAQGDLTCTSVDTGDIADGTILPIDLDDGADTPLDEDCLTYESTGPVFEWQGCGGGFTSFNIDGDNNSPQTITDGNEALFAGGAGILTTASATNTITIATASTETDFIASGALTCGAATEGRAQVHTTPLQYCDNAATPVLQYAAYAASDGDALAGDTATAFFDAGQIEAARGGTGDDTSATTGVPRLTAGNWTYDAGISHLAASSSADLSGVLSDETGGGLAVFGTNPVITFNDDTILTFGTGADVILDWSTADVSNHAFVVGLGAANSAIHLANAGDVANDWTLAADADPQLFLHSNTTPITDYLRLGNHTGTTADIDVVGGTTLNLQIAGTTEATLTATVFDATGAITEAGNAVANSTEEGILDADVIAVCDVTSDDLVDSTCVEQDPGTDISTDLEEETHADEHGIGAADEVAYYGLIDDEGTPLAARRTLNFIGTGISCVDDGAGAETDCTISGGGGEDLQATYDLDTNPVTIALDNTRGGIILDGDAETADPTLTIRDDSPSATDLGLVLDNDNEAGNEESPGLQFRNSTSAAGDDQFTLAVTASGAFVILGDDHAADLTIDTSGNLAIAGQITEAGNAVPNETDILSFFAATTSAELAGVITNETGTGLLVYSTTPSFTTSLTTPVVISGAGDPAEAGVLRLGNAELIAWEAAPAGGDITLTVDASEIMQSSGTFNAAVLTEASNAVPNDTDHLGFFAATSSSQLSGVLDDETGTGLAVFATNPTFLTSALFDNQAEIRLGEPDGAGAEFIIIEAPATLAANRTCTLEDDDTPFDPCITSGGGMTSFDVDGDNNSPETITNAEELLLAGGTNGIDTVASASNTVTFNFDSTEVAGVTWLDNANRTWTFDILAGGTNPTIAFTGSGVELDAHWTIDNQQELRLKEGDGGGENYLGFNAAATVTANGICTLLDSTTDIVPDTCVGGILADELIALGSEISGILPADNGGTGDDTSATTGVPRLTAGNWTYDAGISHLAASSSSDLSGVLSDETGGGLAVFGTNPVITFNDDQVLTWGTGGDILVDWSTADASNHAFVLGLGATNAALHLTNAGDVATDWNVAPNVDPQLFIHSNTTPATDYLRIGHSGTAATILVTGATTLNFDVIGTIEAVLTPTALDIQDNDLLTTGTTVDALGDLLGTLCGTNEILEDQGASWACISTPSGAFTSFNIDGDNTAPQTITDGNTALFVGGLGIDTTAAVTDQVTFDFDAAEIGTETWLDNADRTWTFDIAVAGTNPTLAFAASSIEVDAHWTIDNQQELRLKEGDGGGENYVGFVAPATVTSNGICTLLDSTTDIVPDTCVGGILADELIALGSEVSGTLPADNGGTGDDTSATTGVPRLTAGNWTYDAGISHLATSSSADLLGVLSDETGGGLAVFGTDPVITFDDDTVLTWGTGGDVLADWSTADASNHAFVVGLGATNAALHLANAGDIATDWTLAANAEPQLFIHNNTAPITDYLRIGNHDGTLADIDLVGGTTLQLQIGGTNEIAITSTTVTLGGTLAMGSNNITTTGTVDSIDLNNPGDGIVVSGSQYAVDLNATLDGDGSSSSLAGLEFTATAELALLQGCTDNFILKWNDTPGTWDCEADSTSAASFPDDTALEFGTGTDVSLLWSTADASNHSFVVGLGTLNSAAHFTNAADLATDWVLTADADPQLFIHSDTTPATDYIQIGPHDGTTATIGVTGASTINLKLNDITEVAVTANETTFSGNVVIGTPNTNRFKGGIISKGILVEDVVDSEDIGIYFTDEAITIISWTCVWVGITPSTAVDLRHHTDRSNAGNDVDTTTNTCNKTTTPDTFKIGFEDATIPANSYIWFETSATSGTTDLLHIQIVFTVD